MGSSQSTPAAAVAATTTAASNQLQDTIIPSHASAALRDIRPSVEAPSAALDPEWIQSKQSVVLSNPQNRLAMNALSQDSIEKILRARQSTAGDFHVFNVKIPGEITPVTNQRASGRCWLFATTNVIRISIAKKLNIKEFELSRSHLFFYDKLEKANWALLQYIDLAEKGEDIDGRLFQYMLQAPVNDGGQLDMALNILDKYGCMPDSAFPETYSSSNSSRVNYVITSKLREYCLELCSLVKSNSVSRESLLARKQEMISEIHRILVVTIGAPPQRFSWSYYDADGKYREINDITPKEFLNKYSTDFKTSEMFSLVHDPRNKPGHMTVDRLGNIVGGRPIRYINTNMADLKKAAIAKLKAGIPVFFGCDVGQFMERDLGVLDVNLVDYSLGLGTAPGLLPKAQRLRVGESLMTHAMTLTGVHLDSDGNSVRWRIENSWGKDVGKEGYFVATDAWMDQYLFQIVVAKKDAPELAALLDTKPQVLPAWDPMGSLA